MTDPTGHPTIPDRRRSADRRAAVPVELVRTAHAVPTVAVTLLAGLLSVAVGLTPGETGHVMAAVLAGQLSIGWSNDLLDRARDRAAGRGDKPLATGRLGVRTVWLACGLALAASVALSLALGLLPGSVHLVGVACGWAYNLGVKSTVWSWAPYAVAFGTLAAVPSLVADGGTTWWLPVTGAALGVGAHLVNVLPDLEDDATTGVRGLPHRLGPRLIPPVAVALFAGATGLMLVAAPADPPLSWATAAVVGLLVVVALTGRGRTPFRAAIAIALVDVLTLAWVL